jgi:hypothetical protein
MDSVSRSIQELETYLPSPPPFDLIEHYTAKKTYYPAAINRVLGVLDRGYKNRATFNGEIGRNYHDLLDRWNQLQGQMRKMDEALLEKPSDDDEVKEMSRQVKNLNIVTEGRPRSSGSSSSNTTLTQGAISPTGQSSSRGSSVRSGARVSSLPPPQRRESLLTTPTPRNRSVSTATTTTTTTSSSSRQSRLHIPFFTPRARIRTPVGDRTTSTPIGTGTGGLIPIQARPRWNSSPIANVLGSTPPKIPSTKLPTVVITPSRIPRSGRATPTKGGSVTPSVTPGRLASGRQSMGSSTSISPNKRVSMSLPRAVSNPNPNTPRATPAPETPPVPKIPEVYNRRQTVNFSSTPGMKAKLSSIPRPSTAQGMNARSVSGPAGQALPRWRG